MIKIVAGPRQQLIRMHEMRPLQVGMVECTGEVVMRTASTSKIEVMSISQPCKDRCWTFPRDVREYESLQVRLLGPGEKVVLELSNE